MKIFSKESFVSDYFVSDTFVSDTSVSDSYIPNKEYCYCILNYSISVTNILSNIDE